MVETLEHAQNQTGTKEKNKTATVHVMDAAAAVSGLRASVASLDHTMERLGYIMRIQLALNLHAGPFYQRDSKDEHKAYNAWGWFTDFIGNRCQMIRNFLAAANCFPSSGTIDELTDDPRIAKIKAEHTKSFLDGIQQLPHLRHIDDRTMLTLYEALRQFIEATPKETPDLSAPRGDKPLQMRATAAATTGVVMTGREIRHQALTHVDKIELDVHDLTTCLRILHQEFSRVASQ